MLRAQNRALMKKTKELVIDLQLSGEERASVEAAAKQNGFPTASDYLRSLLSKDLKRITKDTRPPEIPLREYFSTKLGTIWNGNSLDLLAKTEAGSVNLIMTSPPFGLIKRKSYGNEDAHSYCEWFQPFAEQFFRVMASDASLVIDIGGAWNKGTPTRSLYHFKLLIMLCEEYGFHLCLEHYWWNTAKLPSPAEWVNIRRVRPKDAVNCIWWLSKTPWPKASNRRVLTPYSDSMKKLLKNGYTAKPRPSGHVISKKFGVNNGGAVPPNLLALANTESTGHYQKFCRENGYEVHPARFPAQLPEYFIRMTTDPGDFVLDPFGGSCVTGMVAERLDRRWACVEKNVRFLTGAVARFDENSLAVLSGRSSVAYSIYSPCAVPVDEKEVRLVKDGGKERPVGGVSENGK
jgi:DNA modification methylase